MDAKDEVKERLSVEEVIGEYLELRRAGRNFKALSPFTSEKTPSFIVSPEKQIWHDFSSGKGGDIFSFVMEMEGVDFRQSLEILARRAGVELKTNQGDGQRAKYKERLQKAVETAARYYHVSLSKNQTALDYVVKKRGYGKQILTDFVIGYAPNNGSALTEFMRKKGFSDKELRDAGLSVTRRGQLSDMFIARIMVPLADGQGRVIGFTARVLDDSLPKYINTPQTLLYDKSRHVFGLHLAKQDIREKGYVVVVEGNMDVVASHKTSVKNVVATAGTAITKSHFTQLSRLTDDVRMAFDQDKAGLAATERAIPIAQEVGVNLSIITIPSGKDPDDLIKQSVSEWEHAVEKKQYVVDWVIEQYKQKLDINSAQGKKEFSDAVLKVVIRLQDPVEQDHYVEVVAKTISASKAAIQSKLDNLNKKAAPKRKVRVEKKEYKIDSKKAYQDQLLGLALMFPDTASSLERIEPRYFEGEARQSVAVFAKENRKAITGKIPEELRNFEEYVKIILLKTEELYAAWSSPDRLIEAIGLARRLNKDYNQKRTKNLSEQIKRAEASGDFEAVQSLLEQVQDILKEN